MLSAEDREIHRSAVHPHIYICPLILTHTHTHKQLSNELISSHTHTHTHTHSKNVVYNYTDAEAKVREATSNDPWGPSSAIMSELAEFSFHVQAYGLVMGMLWKRLNDHGKNWRHVYKVCRCECVSGVGREGCCVWEVCRRECVSGVGREGCCVWEVCRCECVSGVGREGCCVWEVCRKCLLYCWREVTCTCCCVVVSGIVDQLWYTLTHTLAHKCTHIVVVFPDTGSTGCMSITVLYSVAIPIYHPPLPLIPPPFTWLDICSSNYDCQATKYKYIHTHTLTHMHTPNLYKAVYCARLCMYSR